MEYQRFVALGDFMDEEKEMTFGERCKKAWKNIDNAQEILKNKRKL